MIYGYKIGVHYSYFSQMVKKHEDVKCVLNRISVLLFMFDICIVNLLIYLKTLRCKLNSKQNATTHLLKAGLDEVSLVNKALFKVHEAILFQLVRLLSGDLFWVAHLGQEGSQVVNLHLLLPHLLLQLLSLLN